MAVTLQNKTKRKVTLVLPHAKVCTEEDCQCRRQRVGVTSTHPVTGAKIVRALQRKLAGSVHIMAAGTGGDSVSGLPNGVAALRQVKAMLKAKQLVLTVDDPKALHAAKVKLRAARVARLVDPKTVAPLPKYRRAQPAEKASGVSTPARTPETKAEGPAPAKG